MWHIMYAKSGRHRMDKKKHCLRYVEELTRVLLSLPMDDIENGIDILWQCHLRGGTIFTMGNGGHGNTASHAINDLAKDTISSDDKEEVIAGKHRFRTMCLNDSMSFVTGLGNDMGHEHVFSEQLANWVEDRDVVIGISGSGNSRNVLDAFRVARKAGASSVCLSGFKGGKARDIADLCIVVPGDSMIRIEDAHLAILHLWADALREMVREDISR